AVPAPAMLFPPGTAPGGLPGIRSQTLTPWPPPTTSRLPSPEKATARDRFNAGKSLSSTWYSCVASRSQTRTNLPAPADARRLLPLGAKQTPRTAPAWPRSLALRPGREGARTYRIWSEQPAASSFPSELNDRSLTRRGSCQELLGPAWARGRTSTRPPAKPTATRGGPPAGAKARQVTSGAAAARPGR